MARSLGISYLWIDALCIWQDDDNDKKLELEKMNRYYANCALVIQPSGTESVSEGFLDLAYRSRNRGVFESYSEPFPFKSANGEEGIIYVCPGEQVDWYRKSDEPAAKRSWILQEETLCRRVLVFPAGGGMIFRCDSCHEETNDGNVLYDPDARDPPRNWTKDKLLERPEDLEPVLFPLSGRVHALWENVRCLSEVPGMKPSLILEGSNACIRFGDNGNADGSETNDDADGSSEGLSLFPVHGANDESVAHTKSLAFLRRHGSPGGMLVHTRTPPGFALPTEIHDTWKQLVTDYCARDLTKASDKLIAIDALAREFQERYSRALGSYHAGLWSQFAPAGLIWRSTRPEPPDAELRVPSWSWAAVRAASYPDTFRHTKDIVDGADFKDVDIEIASPVSAEERGEEVKQIRLVAKLLDVWWGLDKTSDLHQWHRLRPRQRLWHQLRLWLQLGCRWGLDPTPEEELEEHSEGDRYALFQKNGKAITKEVYPDHSVDLPLSGRQRVVMMLGRRYVSGVGHDKDHHGEVLLLRKQENGTYVRIAFATLLFEDFEKKWEPRFKVETIILA